MIQREPRTKEQIDKSLKTMEAIRSNAGLIADSLYYKSLVCIAYEYLYSSYDSEALLILHSIPLSYYSDTQLPQMESDSQYADLVAWIAYRIIQMDLVPGDTQKSDVGVNMKLAEA